MRLRSLSTLAVTLLLALGLLTLPNRAHASGVPDGPIMLLGVAALGVVVVGGVMAIGVAATEIGKAVEEDEKKTAAKESAKLRVTAIATPDGAHAAISGRF